MTPGSERGAPRSASLVDAAVVAFAAWTLVCNAVALAGGSFRTAALAGPVAVVAALGLAVVLSRRRLAAPAVAADGSAGESPSAMSLARVGAVAVALVVASYAAESPALLWLGGILLLGVPFVRHAIRGAPPASPVPGGRSGESALWLLGAAGALFGLVVQRPDHDDAYYVNVAAVAVDRPDAPLLAFDTLLGVPDLPSILPVYKVQAFELLAGWLAAVTPLSAIETSHWVLPAAVGLLLPFAWARLLRIVAPERWLAAVIATFAVFISVGGSNVWHANLGLVRMHQGKAVFVAAMVPLILAYALEYVRRPGPGPFAKLFLVQVASVGLTSTALWAAPVIAGLGLAAGAVRSPRILARLALGLAASIYPIAIALLLRDETAGTVAFAGSEESQRIIGFDLYPIWQRLDDASSGGEILAIAAEGVLGRGGMAAACVVSALAAWTTLPDGVGRRLALALPLGFLLFLANPYTVAFVADHVTGRLTIERAFWLVPFPVFLALVITAPLAWRTLSLPVRAAGVGLLAVVLLGILPDARVLERENGVRIDPMALKVQPAEYEAARRVVALAPPGSHVLAPNPVSVWIGTFHDAPYPLVARRGYFRMYAAHLSREDVRDRLELSKSLAFRSLEPDSPKAERLRRGIERYDIRAVCVHRRAHGTRQVLLDLGMRRADATERYEIWVR